MLERLVQLRRGFLQLHPGAQAVRRARSPADKTVNLLLDVDARWIHSAKNIRRPARWRKPVETGQGPAQGHAAPNDGLSGFLEFRADTTAQIGYSPTMSKAEIVAELPKLTRAEREEIRLELAELDSKDWLDEDDPLTEGEKALIAARIEAHERSPETAISWEEFEARLKRRLA